MDRDVCRVVLKHGGERDLNNVMSILFELEIPNVRMFKNYKGTVALLHQSHAKVLRSVKIKKILTEKGIEVVDSPEERATRTLFIRRLPEEVKRASEEDLVGDLESKNNVKINEIKLDNKNQG